MSILLEHINRIIRDNPDKVQQARKRPELAGWFFGQVMKDTDGAYCADDVRALLTDRGIKADV